MSVFLVGNPPFPATTNGERLIAKLEHIWHSARRWGKERGHAYVSSYGVVGIAPT